MFVIQADGEKGSKSEKNNFEVKVEDDRFIVAEESFCAGSIDKLSHRFIRRDLKRKYNRAARATQGVIHIGY